MSSHGQSASSAPSSRLSTPDNPNSEKSYQCICGKGDGSGNYILCDNEECSLGWYHWECQKVTEEPVGTWLCFRCSPNSAFYAKQLAKRPAALPKVVTPSSSKGKQPIAGLENEQNPVTKKQSTAKKGLAVKKPVPDTPKPKWKGWQSMASDEEEEFKQNVDAKWVEDGVIGRRRKSTKVASEEHGSGSRTLRTRAKPKAQDTKGVSSDSASSSSSDSEKSVYQEEENGEDKGEGPEDDDDEAEEEEGEDENEDNDDAEAEEEEPSSEDSSSREKVSEASEEHEDSEDNMDVDEENDHAAKDSLSISPSQLPPNGFLRGITEYSESPMEVDFDQDGNVEPSGSDHSNPSDNSSKSPQTTPPRVFYARKRGALLSPSPDNSSPSTQTTPERVFYARKRGQPVSFSPDSTPRASPAGSPVHSHISISSSLDQISISDGDNMEIDNNDDDEPEVQILEGQEPVFVTPAVESDDIATRYQRQGNRWGEAPESAVRSTLPRLG